ncbi:class I adenylate-forming enzyme family protein [Brevibacterium ravenspurgense]|uniref:class I adenylate-forming enzyme family protein n=1 Tax=Brevibacterium ravenspurgense TaxID=479117 RepID=UPI0002D8467D|nr:AMP-binding protein [Brevibacterium ravenspurgense]
MAHLSTILERTAQRRPEATALISDELTMSYPQLNAAANQFARVLADHGVGKGDRVVLNSINSPYFVVAAYAVFKLGAVLSPANPQSTGPELAYFLRDSGAKAFVAHPALAKPSADAFNHLGGGEEEAPAPEAPIGLSLGPVDPSTSGADRFTDALALTTQADDTNLGTAVEESDNALILYTSGTTGNPKGAVLDHHAAIWAGMSLGLSTGLHEGERVLMIAPMYHSAPLTNVLFPTILAAGAIVIRPTFDPQDALNAIEKHKCTFTFAVPTMLALMLRVPNVESIDVSSMQRIFYGAAPMPGSLVTRVIDAFPNARLTQGTGLTEGGPGGAVLTHEEILERPWASGRGANPNGVYRIVDPEGNDVAEGEVGEMILKSESMMKGYWNKPEESAKTIRDGWLHTGDLAKRESDGFMTLVDRMKDMIISGGKNIYSAEVENAVSGHPGVLDVAVVGDLHEVYGETVVAVIVPADPENPPTLESIREHAAQTLAKFKLPRKVLYRDIPRNPSGKILKHRLRDAVRAESAGE